MLKELGDIGIHFFRHGESFYRQDIVPMAEANDLTESGVDQVRFSSEILSTHIKSRGSCPSVIVSSPLGRALQTAKLIAGVFDDRGMPMRKKLDSSLHGILVIPQLQDQIDSGRSEIGAQMEPLENAQRRMLKVLKRMLAAQNAGQFSELVLVSHDALTGFLVHKFTEGKRSKLELGEFMSIVKSGDNLSARIGDIEEIYSFSTAFLSFFSAQP